METNTATHLSKGTEVAKWLNENLENENLGKDNAAFVRIRVPAGDLMPGDVQVDPKLKLFAPLVKVIRRNPYQVSVSFGEGRRNYLIHHRRILNVIRPL